MKISVAFCAFALLEVMPHLSLWVDAVPVPNCNDRSQEWLHEKWSSLHFQSGIFQSIPESFLMIPPYLNQIQNSITNTGTENNFTNTGMENYSTSPNSNASLQSRLLCPWYWVRNHEVGRYPFKLASAKCSCQKCINNGAQQCEQVFYNVKVLKKDPSQACDDDGYYVYETKYQPIAVGCTCAVAKT